MKILRNLFFAITLAFLFPVSCLAVTLNQEISVVNKIDIPASFSTKVTARIGGYLFHIEGLTSPWAKVEFYSTQGNINLEAIADDKGVFRFVNALMPLSTGDFCFISIDTNLNGSPPLCFTPPPPQTKTNIIGVVLPPSLTIEENVFHQNDTVAASGKTTPDSEINVYLFEDENPPLMELIDIFAPKVMAREGPLLSISSNKDGEFVFNLPSTKSTSWRMFVGTQKNQLGENPSPKSNILQFASLSWWKWFLLTVIVWLLKLFAWLTNIFSQPMFIIVSLLTAITAMIVLIRGQPLH